jgi:excisionase family DNA binding protein
MDTCQAAMKRTNTITKLRTAKREVRPKEAAELMHCSIGYVYLLLSEGAIESRKVCRRGYDRGIRLIDVASLEKWLAQRAHAEGGAE